MLHHDGCTLAVVRRGPARSVGRSGLEVLSLSGLRVDRSIEKRSVECHPMKRMSKQRGVSLLIVLVVLAITLVGSLAMLRSGEVSSMVAGNVSFREAATQASDLGIADAAKALDVQPNFDANIANTYFATRQPEDTNGLPTTINWSSVPTMAVGN